MATAAPLPAGSNGQQETPQQQLDDVLIAAYDPILWMRDTLIWFLEAGDLPKANAILQVYLDMTQDAMDVARVMVDAANQAAALDAINNPPAGM